jgi:hypothetical protein
MGQVNEFTFVAITRWTAQVCSLTICGINHKDERIKELTIPQIERQTLSRRSLSSPLLFSSRHFECTRKSNGREEEKKIDWDSDSVNSFSFFISLS